MSTHALQKLIFVYNADSGTVNALLDSVHKVVSPSTYNCNLCDITFGLVGEKKIWKEFRNSYPIEMDFLHRDEFKKDYASKFGYKFEYPIVLGVTSGGLEVVVNTDELNSMKAPEELVTLLKDRVPPN